MFREIISEGELKSNHVRETGGLVWRKDLNANRAVIFHSCWGRCHSLTTWHPGPFPGEICCCRHTGEREVLPPMVETEGSDLPLTGHLSPECEQGSSVHPVCWHVLRSRALSLIATGFIDKVSRVHCHIQTCGETSAMVPTACFPWRLTHPHLSSRVLIEIRNL